MRLFALDLFAGWKNRTAQQLADMLTSQDKMKPLTLLELFTAAQTPPNNAIGDELFGIYNGSKNNDGFVKAVELQLRFGKVAAVAALVGAGKKNTGWTNQTESALMAVIEANVIAPTAEEVTAELAVMGFEFVNGRWVSVSV